jgi:hypothetical protein
MTKVVFAAWLLVACSLALGKDPTPLALPKGARVGILNLLDHEITHFHNAKVLTDSFLKTQPIRWQVDSMLSDAVTQHLTELGMVVVPVGPSDQLKHNREDFFVNNSVAKGLPKEVAREFAAVANAEHLDALIVLASGLNNSAQAAGLVRRGLPDYLRGWGFVTLDGNEKPTLFNMTQLLLIGLGPDGATLRAREWGGGYTDEWIDYSPPPNPKQIPNDELDKLQPLFARILSRQAGHLMEWIVPAT